MNPAWAIDGPKSHDQEPDNEHRSTINVRIYTESSVPPSRARFHHQQTDAPDHNGQGDIHADFAFAAHRARSEVV